MIASVIQRRRTRGRASERERRLDARPERAGFVDVRGASTGARNCCSTARSSRPLAAAAGPFFMAAAQAGAAERPSTLAAGDPIATRAAAAAKKSSRGTDAHEDRRDGAAGRSTPRTSRAALEQADGRQRPTVVEATFARHLTKTVAEHIAHIGRLRRASTPRRLDPRLRRPRGDHRRSTSYVKKYKAQSTFVGPAPPLPRCSPSTRARRGASSTTATSGSSTTARTSSANAKLRKAYKAKFKRDLRPPKIVGRVSTRPRSSSPTRWRPKVYGPGMGAALGNPGNQFYFFQHFRNIGGSFFDPKTMKAQINNAIGVKAMSIDPDGDQGLAARHQQVRLRERLGATGCRGRRR